MKTRIISLIKTVFIAGALLTSCGEKSKQDATEVKEDIKELNKDLTRGAIDTAEEIKTGIKQEWEKFKTASEKTIENTEKEIQNLREKISKINEKERNKLTRKLNALEQRHLVLKDKLAVRTKEFKDNKIEFNKETKANEKEFEHEFDHAMKEISKALKDLFKNNMD